MQWELDREYGSYGKLGRSVRLFGRRGRRYILVC